jgi:hypothetical protein
VEVHRGSGKETANREEQRQYKEKGGAAAGKFLRLVQCVRAPTCWAMRIVEAMVTPKMAPSSRKMTMLELFAPVSAAAPRNLPIHTALMEPLADT